MKKLIASFILILMLYNLFGYYLVYLYMLTSNNERISEFISTQSEIPYTILKFRLNENKVNDKDFVRMDENEFMYRNEMYDVFKKEYSDGYIIFYCFKDKKEDEIRQNLFTHIEQNSSSGKKQIYLSNFRIKNCIIPEFTMADSRSFMELIYSMPVLNYTYSFKEIEFPPPRTINI